MHLLYCAKAQITFWQPHHTRTRARSKTQCVQELHIDGMNTLFQPSIVWVGHPRRWHACARRDAIAQKARNSMVRELNSARTL